MRRSGKCIFLSLQLLTSHLEKHPYKTNMICVSLLENQGRNHKWCSFTYGRAQASQPVRTYLHQPCVDTGCNLEEDLLWAMDDREEERERERERERVREIRAVSATWWWWWFCLYVAAFSRSGPIDKYPGESYYFRMNKVTRFVTRI